MAETKVSGVEVVDSFSGKKAIFANDDAVAMFGDKANYRGSIDFRTNYELVAEVQRVFGVSPLTDGSNPTAMWQMLFEKLGLKLSPSVFEQHNKSWVDSNTARVAASKAKRAEASAVKKQLEQTNTAELVVINAWKSGHENGKNDQQIHDELEKNGTSKELLTKFFPNIAKK